MEWMDGLGWLLIVVLFLVGMAGAVFPVLPGVLAVYAAFFVYGFFFGFEEFGIGFWFTQTFIVAAVIAADYAVSALGVQKFGGTRASVIGSTIGILVGPFVIPVIGLIAGPFIGAVLGELIIGTNPQQAVKVGVGSVIGFLSSVIVKLVLQLVMIILFVIWII
jgi:uncharacterized protein